MMNDLVARACAAMKLLLVLGIALMPFTADRFNPVTEMADYLRKLSACAQDPPSSVVNFLEQSQMKELRNVDARWVLQIRSNDIHPNMLVSPINPASARSPKDGFPQGQLPDEQSAGGFSSESFDESSFSPNAFAGVSRQPAGRHPAGRQPRSWQPQGWIPMNWQPTCDYESSADLYPNPYQRAEFIRVLEMIREIAFESNSFDNTIGDLDQLASDTIRIPVADIGLAPSDAVAFLTYMLGATMLYLASTLNNICTFSGKGLAENSGWIVFQTGVPAAIISFLWIAFPFVVAIIVVIRHVFLTKSLDSPLALILALLFLAIFVVRALLDVKRIRLKIHSPK